MNAITVCVGWIAALIFMYWPEICFLFVLAVEVNERTNLERSQRKKSCLRNRVQSLPTVLRHSNWKWLLVFLKGCKIQKKMKAAFEQRILLCTVYWLNLWIYNSYLPSTSLKNLAGKTLLLLSEEFRTIVVFKADGHVLFLLRKLRSSYYWALTEWEICFLLETGLPKWTFVLRSLIHNFGFSFWQRINQILC